MPTQTLMPVEEYLESSFEDGDREYVDGELLEYNMGEVDHGEVQGLIHSWFSGDENTSVSIHWSKSVRAFPPHDIEFPT